MLVEWFFLISVLSGPFDVDRYPDTGWRDVERGTFKAQDLGTCERLKHELHQHYVRNPVPGGAVIITGCQPRHTQ